MARRVQAPAPIPHAVYRIYGPAGLILYIGHSRNPRGRISQHRSINKHTWAPLIMRYEIDWYPHRGIATYAETRELRAVRPLCNPVIPEADGKHRTIVPGLKPKRSLYARVDEIATIRGETVIDVMERALGRYVHRQKLGARRHRRERIDKRSSTRVLKNYVRRHRWLLEDGEQTS